MWFFNRKKTIAASGILTGATDYHSHILPGMDDGVGTIQEALDILARYEALGIRALWLTPHIMEDIPNSPKKLKERFFELRVAYTGKIKLHLAAEYMIDNHLRYALDTMVPGSIYKDMMSLGNTWKHILVETSYYNSPIKMRETIGLVKEKGYIPLLAHPERYMYLENSEYQKLHNEGVRFQLNLASLAGCYGPVVKKKAEWLLSNGLYYVAGSDLHSEETLEIFKGCKLKKQHLEQLRPLLHKSL